MKISEIKVHPYISKLFQIDPEILKSIEKNMKAKGYDPAHPIVTWKGTGFLVEGHTRFEAARYSKLKNIPTDEKEFKSLDDAVAYAVRSQFERRNLTDADIFRLIPILDNPMQRGGDRKSERAKSNFGGQKSDSRDRTAKLLKISKDKVSKCRFILNVGKQIKRLAKPPGKPIFSLYDYSKWGRKLIRKILKGNMSINQGYNQIQGMIKRLENFNERDKLYNFRDQEKRTPEQEAALEYIGLQKNLNRLYVYLSHHIIPLSEHLVTFKKEYPQPFEELYKEAHLEEILSDSTHLLEAFGYKIKPPSVPRLKNLPS